MSSDPTPEDADPKTQSRNAFALILLKLGRRDHSERELTRALARKGFSEEAAVSALARAKREGLVNDERLAESVARSAARSGKRGPLRVVAALRNKGVAKETAHAKTTEAFKGSDEADSKLLAFADRLLRRAKGETPKDKRIRAIRSLLSRGFELSEAKRAVHVAENALMTENIGNDADR